MDGEGEVDRRGRIELVPGVVDGALAAAVGIGADLFDAARVVAVESDPEARILLLAGRATRGRLRPAPLHVGESRSALVGRVPRPVETQGGSPPDRGEQPRRGTVDKHALRGGASSTSDGP